jgi:hypothetical protein
MFERDHSFVVSPEFLMMDTSMPVTLLQPEQWRCLSTTALMSTFLSL